MSATMYYVPPGSSNVLVKCGPDCATLTILPHGPIKTAIQHTLSRAQLEVMLLAMVQERRTLSSGNPESDKFEELSAEVRATFWRGQTRRALVLLEDVNANAMLRHDRELQELIGSMIRDLTESLK